ncbi:endogalactosylceramidase domain protein [Rhodococcus sp. MTM3W5.2]|uniref:hypothetical protein n=1 Tax=Rhodococcus sp. MTM3W5.2 TaxID=1805827 RepID=UPI000979763C|nr:hypothetical protein [Rhodococcus sp. MTM3W5.2]AQA21466.1 endogalactosylceramidase domain protein [Rhodococcus sp. MTM3W5.2]
MTERGFTGAGVGRLEAWHPGAERPGLDTANVADITLTRIEGGWRLTGNTACTYRVTKN